MLAVNIVTWFLLPLLMPVSIAGYDDRPFFEQVNFFQCDLSSRKFARPDCSIELVFKDQLTSFKELAQ